MGAVVGPVLSQLYSVNSPAVGRIATVTAADGAGGRAVRFDYFVDISSDRWGDKELGLRFSSALASAREFYTDLNGFQMDKHVRRDADNHCTFFDKPNQNCIPDQAQFYPMTTAAHIADAASGVRLSLLAAQPVAAASLADGQMEVLLDRRPRRDDEKGLMEGINDNLHTQLSFALIAEQGRPGAGRELPSLLARHAAEALNRPAVALLSIGGGLKAAQLPTWGGAAPALWPCELTLESLQTHDATTKAWLLRTSYDPTLPIDAAALGCTPTSAPAQPLRLGLTALLPSCTVTTVTPLDLAGKATGPAAAELSIEAAPSVAAVAFTCH